MKTTIVIPTFNRSDFLIRLLTYYIDTQFDGIVLIGDSSNADHFAKTHNFIESFKEGLNVTQINCVGLSNAGAVQSLLEFIKTPYAVFLPDDDFIVTDSLLKCEEFLDENEDFSSVNGIGIAFQLKNGLIFGEVAETGQYQLFSGGESTASQRLISFFDNYFVQLFSVNRTVVFKKMFQDVSKVSEWNFATEYLQCSHSVIAGKIKQLDCLYLLRQIHSERYKNVDTMDWLLLPDWRLSYLAFSDSIASEIARIDGIAVNEASEVVKKAFLQHLSVSLRKSKYCTWKPAALQEFKESCRCFPGYNTVKKIVKSVLSGFVQNLSLDALLKPSSQYHRDFMPIYKIITNGNSDK